MKFFKRGLSLLLCAVVLVVASVPGASAQGSNKDVVSASVQKSNNVTQSLVEQYNSHTFEVSEDRQQELISNAKKDIVSKSVVLHIPDKTQLDYDNAVVRGIFVDEKKKKSQFTVVIPMVGSVVKGSSFSVIYSEKGTVIRTIETQFNDVDSNTGNVKMWLNGKLKSDIDIEKDGNQTDGSTGTVTAASVWSCMNDCLASQGIAAWVIAALGVLCGAFCAITLGIGCIACIQGSGMLVAVTINHCIRQCS